MMLERLQRLDNMIDGVVSEESFARTQKFGISLPPLNDKHKEMRSTEDISLPTDGSPTYEVIETPELSCSEAVDVTLQAVKSIAPPKPKRTFADPGNFIVTYDSSFKLKFW